MDSYIVVIFQVITIIAASSITTVPCLKEILPNSSAFTAFAAFLVVKQD